MLDWAPNSRRVIFVRREEPRMRGSGKENYLIESCDENGSQRVVAESGNRHIENLTWLRDGRVLFSMADPPPNEHSTNIWSIEVDPNTGRPHGPRVQITSGIGFQQWYLSSSADGNRFTFTKTRERTTARIAEVLGPSGNLGTARVLAEDGWERWPFGWTADGKAVFFASNPQGKWGVFRQDVRTQNTQALLSLPEGFPDPLLSPLILSPDRESLLFSQGTKGNGSKSMPNLVRMPVNGGSPTLVQAGRFSSYDCASQANVCVLSEVTAGKETYAFLDPTKGRGSNIAEAQAITYIWTVSPDGKTIAIVPQDQKTVIEFLRTVGQKLPSITLQGKSVRDMVWAPDSQALWVSALVGMDVHILRVGLDGRFKSFWKLPSGQRYPYPLLLSASPDGRYLTFNLWTYENNVTMLENF